MNINICTPLHILTMLRKHSPTYYSYSLRFSNSYPLFLCIKMQFIFHQIFPRIIHSIFRFRFNPNISRYNRAQIVLFQINMVEICCQILDHNIGPGNNILDDNCISRYIPSSISLYVPLYL